MVRALDGDLAPGSDRLATSTDEFEEKKPGRGTKGLRHRGFSSAGARGVGDWSRERKATFLTFSSCYPVHEHWVATAQMAARLWCQLQSHIDLPLASVVDWFDPGLCVSLTMHESKWMTSSLQTMQA